MKVIGLTAHGDPGVLRPLQLPEPHAGAGQVRVRVRAAGVNPTDAMLRTGLLGGQLCDAEHPLVPGMDISGTIDEVGPGVDPAYGLVSGQDVIGLVRNDGSHGGYSEYVVLPAASVDRKPAAASFPEAASFLMNALTAAVTLDAFGLAKGQTLVVTGAAGAYGGHVVQLAAEEGIRVIAVSAGRDEALLRSFGAADFIQRGKDTAARVLDLVPGGADAVADGALLLDRIVPAIRDGGQVSAVRSRSVPVPGRGIRVRRINVGSHVTDRETITRLRRQAEAGVLVMRVAQVFPADDAADAHRMLDAGGVRGRIVLAF